MAVGAKRSFSNTVDLSRGQSAFLDTQLKGKGGQAARGTPFLSCPAFSSYSKEYN